MRRNPLMLVAVLVVLVLVIFLMLRGGGRPPKEEMAKESRLYPSLDTTAVDHITLRSGDVVAEFARGGDGWTVATEGNYPADPEAVQKMLESAAAMTADEMISRKAEKYDIFDLDSAKAVDVVLSAGGSEVARFFVGKTGADFRSTYVRDSARLGVYLEPEPLRSVFDRGERTWRDKAIFHVDEPSMAALELERGGETIRLENRLEDGWVVAKPEGYRPLSAVVQGMPVGLTRLTASEFPPSSEAEQADLEAPAGIVRIIMVDESVKTLVIGAEKPETGLRYVMRGGDDVLFLVPKSRVLNYIKPAEELIEPVPPDTTLVPSGAAEDQGGEDE